MLKNRSAGEAIPAGEERPRKKLSFRDPEVMTPIRSAPLSAPPSKSSSTSSPQLTRPHSVTGVVGLGGLSAHGGVPGISSPSPPPTGSPFFKWVTSPRIPSPSLSPKGVAPHLSNHSSPQSSLAKSETKPIPFPEESKLRGGSTRKDRSPLKDDVFVASPSPPPKSPAQTPAKSGNPCKAEISASNKGNQAKKNIPTHAPQQRQSLRKHHECADMSPTNSQAEKDHNQPHHHSLACPSLEDLELENQAMRVVRTVGQAFEVVHKMTQKEKSSPESALEDDISREGSEDSSEKPKKDGLDSESGQEDLMTLTSDTFNEDPTETQPSKPSKLEPLAPPVGAPITKKVVGETFWSPLSEPLPTGDHLPQAGTPLSVHHELQLLREQLEQQQQQTQAAVAQVHLLRDQLAAETAARLEAQTRTHQLLVHNKELLEHIQQLVLQVREMEVKFQGDGRGSGASPTTLPMTPGLPEMKTELSAPPPPGGASDEVARPGGAPRAKQSSPLSPLSHTLPDTPPTPSPTRAAHTFLFPPPLHPPGSCPTLSPLIPPLPLHRQQELPQFHPPLQQRPLDAGSSTSLASDPGSAHSSGESVTAAIAQLYNMDLSGRLPLVPEDSVALSPLGALPLGAHRVSLNGPITRAASERYSRQETLAQLQRMAWGRHTTK